MDLKYLSAWLKWCYEWLVFLLGAVYFVSSGVLFSCISIVLKPVLSRKRAQFFGRYGMHLLTAVFFFGLKKTGLVQIDFKEMESLKDEKGIILAPNHPCLMDALFVTSVLSNVVCVMKGSIISNPMFFGAAYLGEFIRGDNPLSFIHLSKEALDNGAQLLLFPEGTRTVNDPVNPFKGGFSLLAQKTGAPVQTLIIETENKFLGKKWFLLQKPDFPLIYRVKLGRRFLVGKHIKHKQFTKDLENYFRTCLSSKRA